MKKFIRSLLLVSTGLIATASPLFILAPLQASAAYAYNPADLISDPIFTNSGAMNSSDIQNFLNNENSGLKNKNYTESCDPSQPVDSPSGSYTFAYYPHCGQSESAATIIYDAGRAYGISPQVIMATMQKEQSLITSPSPTSSQINCAMGYNSCSGFSGFFSQVDNGTWQLRTYLELMNGRSWWGYDPSSYPCANASSLYSTGLYPGRTVRFADPGGKAETITLANSSTAALYCYTPYVGPYSATGYSGSYNFVQSFEQWWGSTIDDPVRVTTQTNSSKLGGVGQVQFSLVTQPTANVTIPLSISNPSEGTLNGVSSITITPSSWNAPWANAVNITGLDDGVPDGDIVYYLITGAPSSTDLAYGSLSASEVPDAAITNVDYRSDQAINGGNWNGGKADHVAIKRGNDYFLDYGTSGAAGRSFNFGKWTDTPVVGDWDGKGKTEVGVYRGNIFYLTTNYSSTANIVVSFGRVGDVPVTGNWDGGNKTELGVRRGNIWYLKENGHTPAISFGKVTDTPITGDWNGNGHTDLGVQRGNIWYLREGSKTVSFSFGRVGDVPVTGDWDGSGKTEVGVRRGNVFYLRTSHGTVTFAFGR